MKNESLVLFFSILRSKLFFLVCFVWLLCYGAIGQTYFFDHYGVEEGIPHSRVYSVFQDEVGFVWVGMPNGVARFDGRHFDLFTVSNGLAPNGVKAIASDGNGILWFGHWGGFVTLYIDSVFRVVDSSKLYIRGDVGGFVNDVLGYNWIYTIGSGLVRLKVDSSGNISDVKFYKGAEGLGDRITAAVKLPDGSLLCAVYGAGLQQTTDGETFTSFTVEQYENPGLISSLGMTRAGNVVAGDVMGAIHLIDYQKRTKRTITSVDAGTYITNVVEGWDGTIYGATWGRGLISISTAGEVSFFDPYRGLNALFLIYLATDREGNLLIGSRDEGLFVFKGRFLCSLGRENGLPGDQVWSMIRYHDQVWVGTDKGVAMRSINQPDAVFRQVDHVYRLQSGFQVRCLAASSTTVYAGTLDGGVWASESADHQFAPVGVINAMLPQPALVTALAWFANHLWVATTDG